MRTSKLASCDWEHLDSDTRFLTHGIHRYSGKFIPQIARQAIELYSSPGQLIVDPYCGSGTTLLEAVLTGRRAFGVDLSPLAVLISDVKVTPVASSDLQELLHLADVWVKELSEGQPPLDMSGVMADEVEADPRFTMPFFERWFPRDRLRELLALDQRVRSLVDPALRNIALLAISDILRRSSFANTSYPNVMFDKRKAAPGSILGVFKGRLREIVQAVDSLTLHPSSSPAGSVAVCRADARRLPLADEVADLVVTHPPYIGSIPYAEYGVLSLEWLGVSAKALDTKLTGGKRQTKDVVERFRCGYGEMLCESARILKDAGHIFLMVGNPRVKGDVIDLTAMTTALADAANLKLVDSYHRAGGNRRANLMAGEELLVFSKC